MANESIHPNVVLKALLEKKCRRDKVETLQKLHELCSIEFSRRAPAARDLSAANMARVAESHGLFKARTIYNKQSEDYVALIQAWEAYSGPIASKIEKAPPRSEEKHSFLKKIDDPVVRNLCQIALLERDRLKEEVNMLKGTSVWTIDMRPLGANIDHSSENMAVIEMAAQLTDSERNALTAAIDPAFISRRKWQLGELGEILDERGRCIFRPGFASAIEKILGTNSGRKI